MSRTQTAAALGLAFALTACGGGGGEVITPSPTQGVQKTVEKAPCPILSGDINALEPNIIYPGVITDIVGQNNTEVIVSKGYSDDEPTQLAIREFTFIKTHPDFILKVGGVVTVHITEVCQRADSHLQTNEKSTVTDVLTTSYFLFGPFEPAKK